MSLLMPSSSFFSLSFRATARERTRLNGSRGIPRNCPQPRRIRAFSRQMMWAQPTLGCAGGRTALQARKRCSGKNHSLRRRPGSPPSPFLARWGGGPGSLPSPFLARWGGDSRAAAPRSPGLAGTQRSGARTKILRRTSSPTLCLAVESTLL